MQLKSSYLNLCSSLCCFYCIWLNQSSYLGAFDLLLTVEGNAGPEIDRVVRRDLINLRIFHMEYDMCYGRLPSSFARGFGLQVASFVLLRDPNQNEVKNQGTNEYRNSVARYGSNAIFPPTVFYHTIVKELTAADISSGVLLFGNWLWISVMIKICLVYFLVSGHLCVQRP
ncbi:hypothetical protein MtrunA17_Chr4g0042631 [Medicago truncatula]|uniref:Transmembrane protein n=1 Tax=Medicago truncatula TaxID=3880 RepID=A0A396IE46_MEDTR|nr:hypothetical protein MtrunA17_Chr4g0042631 [Medicago truncatula]